MRDHQGTITQLESAVVTIGGVTRIATVTHVGFSRELKLYTGRVGVTQVFSALPLRQDAEIHASWWCDRASLIQGFPDYRDYVFSMRMANLQSWGWAKK